MSSADQLRLMHLAAVMYYLENKTQSQVAQELGVSRPTVSRLLSQAREEGIVEITVKDPLANVDILAQQLKEELGLSSVIVVPGATDIVPQARRRVGAAAARYLIDSLQKGCKLGIGWGRTLYEVARALERQVNYELTIVPLLGGLGQVDPSFQVHALASLLCEKLGGTFLSLYVPAIVDDCTTRDALLASRDLERMVAAWEELSVALVGIGVFDLNPDFQMLFTDYLDDRALAYLESAGAVGDICMRYYDILGNYIEEGVPNVITIDPERFKKIPRRIAVAGGTWKAQAILGAARGGYINVLITDEPAAERILELIGYEEAAYDRITHC